MAVCSRRGSGGGFGLVVFSRLFGNGLVGYGSVQSERQWWWILFGGTFWVWECFCLSFLCSSFLFLVLYSIPVNLIIRPHRSDHPSRASLAQLLPK